MKVPLKWLQEYVPVNMSANALAEKLTFAGFETQEISAGSSWEHVVIGQITAVNPHPNADRLSLATVALATGEETVVCGAPKLQVGDKIAFAYVGAELIDPYKNERAVLKPAKIRGVESRGMICSEKELGISDSHEGIMVLPSDAPLGKPLAEYLGEVVLDVDITPNRADCLSVIGIAREVAALTNQDTPNPEISYDETEPPIHDYINIEITNSDLCSRYCASLITGITIGESPAWMQERLLACGMRPISNIVDITNYVMLEYGQPLHAFDYDKIRDKKIIVRRAKNGEILESLDGIERKLTGDMLVIADAEKAIAIAGVMGGANSEVLGNTTTILLESANFNPANIHHTSRNLLLTSEASMRFERGIRPGLTVPALKRATQLMIELAGGKAARDIADVYPSKQEPPEITLAIARVKRILGIVFSLEQIIAALESLGFSVLKTGKVPELKVTVPYWRGDITREIDLIEEVARIIGYDQIPTTLLGDPIPRQDPKPVLSLRETLRNSLIGYGFQEIISYSLVGIESMKQLNPDKADPEKLPLRVTNPMTADQEYLRPDLRVNLLAAITTNRRHEDGNIRLFEMAKTYQPCQNELPNEVEYLGAVLSGGRMENSWLGTAAPLSFYDVKGMAEEIFYRLGITASFAAGSDRSLHPSRQTAITVAGQTVGVVGELHPKVAANFDIAESAYLMEINVAGLIPHTTTHKTFQPIPRFPSIIRDLALVVDTTITHQQLQEIITGFPLVKETSVFDVYSGKQVATGKKSLAYRVTYQSYDHTLTDEEVDGVQQKILNKLMHVLGATLRG
ncbi:phenylalanine--tRNA ligase subunit beta [Chloroflexota bacterium]